MSVSKILNVKTGDLTNQQIADFALQEDRARRAALKRGDVDTAADHNREMIALAEQLK